MRDAILHIGMPKTGSTYLQHWLALNRHALLANGLSIAGKPGFGHRVREEFEAYLAGGEILPPDPIDIDGALPGGQASIAMISSEGFSIHKPTEVKRYLELKRLNVIKVVLVLLRQDRYEASIFNQRVKIRGLWEVPEDPTFAMDYMEMWQAWADSFGPDAMVVFDYDQCLGSRKIEDVFLSRLGFPPLIEPTIPEGPIATNPSPNAALMEIIRLSNMRGHPPMVSAIKQHALGRMPREPRFGLTQDAVTRIESCFLKSNRELARRIGGEGLEGLTTPGWKSRGKNLTGADVTAELIELIGILADATAAISILSLDPDLMGPIQKRRASLDTRAIMDRTAEIAARANGNIVNIGLLLERAEGAGTFEPDLKRADATPSIRAEPTIERTSFNELIDLAAFAVCLLKARQETQRRRNGERAISAKPLLRVVAQPLRNSWLLRPDLLIRKAQERIRIF